MLSQPAGGSAEKTPEVNRRTRYGKIKGCFHNAPETGFFNRHGGRIARGLVSGEVHKQPASRFTLRYLDMNGPFIMHIDMNAFFASIEQRDNPGLRGKPIAVTGAAKRTVVTTASYEAREYGVKTGMNRYEAKRVCPQLIFVTGDNGKYIDASVKILDILKDFSPKVEACSIDEAFLDIKGINTPSPEDLASRIKGRIMDEIGLTCSVGIAPNKLLAKLASDMKKPDGLVVIREEDVAPILEDLPVRELCGIGPRLTVHLGGLGITTCGQLGRFPASVLRERFGIIGERLKDMGRGIDPSPVIPAGEEERAKSVGHSMTLPQDISDKAVLKGYILKLSEMVGARARAHGLKGRKVTLTLRYADFYTFTRQRTLSMHTNDTRVIYNLAVEIMESLRLKSSVRLVGVSISGLAENCPQMELFDEGRRREALLKAVDFINSHFGEFTLTWGTLAGEKEDTGVISPSWRPAGVRKVNVK